MAAAKAEAVSRLSKAVIFLLFSSLSSTTFAKALELSHLNRSSFPPGFLFGVSSSAYQYEGAAFEDGKGPSIWDTYTHKFPEKIVDGSNGDVADDFYHKYKEDIKLMKFVGLNSFRMSISWPRVIPTGKISGGINQEGVAFYNNVINELLANGITPFVTLFHWDLPQGLGDEYRGFLSPLVINDFKDFVNLCFKEFGDRVKHWITMNEPFTFVNGGYNGNFLGNLAPGRCSARNNCPQGNAATEPYIVAHHLLICHAETVKIYSGKYKATQAGEIGITLGTYWFIPYSQSKQDIQAAHRALDFVYGWFIHPLVYGSYPRSMIALVGDRLPQFTEEQAIMLKGSYDFLGLNYYTGNYARHMLSFTENISSTTDNRVIYSTDIKGVPIGEATGVPIFYVYPQGLHDLLVYTKQRYNNPVIYITENGMGEINNGTVQSSVDDCQRVDFYNRHFKAVRLAMKEGVNVKGFFAWSFLDTFEWGSGYSQRFGLIHVDFQNGLQRIPKKSALWLRSWLTNKITRIKNGPFYANKHFPKELT